MKHLPDQSKADPEEEPGDGGSPGPDADDGRGGNEPTGC